MTSVRTAVLCFLIAATPSHMHAEEPLPHLRSTDTRLAAAVAIGTRESGLFRELAARVNASNLIVYLMTDPNPRFGVAGHLTIAGAAGGVRYVRISIRRGLSGCDLIAVVGHELRHPVEIAAAPWVVDQASMARFYSAIGVRDRSEIRPTFDTAAAVADGARIRRDIVNARPAGRLIQANRQSECRRNAGAGPTAVADFCRIGRCAARFAPYLQALGRSGSCLMRGPAAFHEA